jgi:hypothetical protein
MMVDPLIPTWAAAMAMAEVQWKRRRLWSIVSDIYLLYCAACRRDPNAMTCARIQVRTYRFVVTGSAAARKLSEETLDAFRFKIMCCLPFDCAPAFRRYCFIKHVASELRKHHEIEHFSRTTVDA